MGLFGMKPKRTKSAPSWGGPPPCGPLRFDPDVHTAAESVGRPVADLPVVDAPAPSPPVAAGGGGGGGGGEQQSHVAA